MKNLQFVGLGLGLIFILNGFSGFCQQTKPSSEEKIKAKVERFNETHPISAEKSEALTRVLLEYQEKVKEMKNDEKISKEAWQELRKERHTAISVVLSDSEFKAWKAFQKEEHEAMKQRMEQRRQKKHLRSKPLNNEEYPTE